MITTEIRLSRRGRRCVTAVITAAGVWLAGCTTTSPNYQEQRSFGSADDAAAALVEATRSGDVAVLEGIFGPRGKQVLSSGDAIADRNNREVFAIAATQRWSLERIDGSTKELVVGHEQWPFPIPLVRDSRGWWFDTVAGEREVLARRIGRNELATIGTLRMYVAAQLRYAQEGRDGKPAGIYAQRIRSEPGTNNGLYWPTPSPSDPVSPLGDFAAIATREGYGNRPEGQEPFHGYFYRILTRQGPDAPGGARDYITQGDMSGGFAMIAFPADYANSGILSFLVGPDGVIWNADLGPDTATLAAQIKEFNPDARWMPED